MYYTPYGHITSGSKPFVEWYKGKKDTYLYIHVYICKKGLSKLSINICNTVE